MTSNQHLIEEAINLLVQNPDRSHDQLIKELQLKWCLDQSRVKVILSRARFQLDLETRRWLTTHRRCRKPLPGETRGFFDNIIRAMEDGMSVELSSS